MSVTAGRIKGLKFRKGEINGVKEIEEALSQKQGSPSSIGLAPTQEALVWFGTKVGNTFHWRHL